MKIKMKNKRGGMLIVDSLLRIVAIIVLFLVLLGGIYFLYTKFVSGG